jgi:hypothetical protein
MFPLQLRLGKITRQTVASRFSGWLIMGGYSLTFDASGEDFQPPILARFVLLQKLRSISFFPAWQFIISGELCPLCMAMCLSVREFTTFGMDITCARSDH